MASARDTLRALLPLYCKMSSWTDEPGLASCIGETERGTRRAFMPHAHAFRSPQAQLRASEQSGPNAQGLLSATRGVPSFQQWRPARLLCSPLAALPVHRNGATAADTLRCVHLDGMSVGGGAPRVSPGTAAPPRLALEVQTRIPIHRSHVALAPPGEFASCLRLASSSYTVALRACR